MTHPKGRATALARREYLWDHYKRLSDCHAADVENPPDEFWDDRNEILDFISEHEGGDEFH